MSKLPSMPFMVDAYIADTTHLSLEEHGAYLLLLCAMWRRDGYLEDNDKDNARVLGVGSGVWRRLKPRLMPLMTVIGGRITQKKLQEQWNYAQENRVRQSEKGKLGAKARSERNQGLESIRSLGHGLSNGSAREQASLYNKNIPIPLSNTVGIEEGSEQEPSARVSRLLNTNLMRKTG